MAHPGTIPRKETEHLFKKMSELNSQSFLFPIGLRTGTLALALFSELVVMQTMKLGLLDAKSSVEYDSKEYKL